MVTLNGASLLALLSMLGGQGEAAVWLGFNRDNALIAAVAFSVGLTLAGYSIARQLYLSTTESGDAAARAITLRRLVALYDQEATAENHKRLGEVMKEFHELSLTGFQFSTRAAFAQHFSAGAWSIGILIPLSTALGPAFKTLSQILRSWLS